MVYFQILDLSYYYSKTNNEELFIIMQINALIYQSEQNQKQKHVCDVVLPVVDVQFGENCFRENLFLLLFVN